jgi:translation initiation factor 2 alpha subunit (eIF-2alpha)
MKSFPTPGDLVPFRVDYVDEHVAHTTLLEYVDLTGYIMSTDETSDLVSNADTAPKLAFVRRANERTGAIDILLKTNC